MWFKIVGWVGAVALLAGLVMGWSPLSSGGESCGSVFSPANFLIAPMSCGDVRNVLAIPVRILLIGGGVGLFLGGIGALDARNQRRAREARGAGS